MFRLVYELLFFVLPNNGVYNLSNDVIDEWHIGLNDRKSDSQLLKLGTHPKKKIILTKIHSGLQSHDCDISGFNPESKGGRK